MAILYGKLRVLVEGYAWNEGYVMNPAEGDIHYLFETIINKDGKDVIYLYIYGEYEDAVKPFRISFEEREAPDAPFYIRWINRRGGYDYKMLSCRNSFTRRVEKNKEFIPHQSQTIKSRGTHERLSFEAKEVVVAAITQMPRSEFEWVSLLLYSPKIQVYSQALADWVTITLSGNHSVSWDTGGMFADMEVEFRLPEPNTQNK